MFAKDRTATLLIPFNLVPGVLVVTATCFTAAKGGGEAGVSVIFQLNLTSTVKRVAMSLAPNPSFKVEDLPIAAREPYKKLVN